MVLSRPMNNGEIQGIGLASENPSKLFHNESNKWLSEFKPPGAESCIGNILKEI